MRLFRGGGLRGEHGRPSVGTNGTFLLFTWMVTAVGLFRPNVYGHLFTFYIHFYYQIKVVFWEVLKILPCTLASNQSFLVNVFGVDVLVSPFPSLC